MQTNNNNNNNINNKYLKVSERSSSVIGDCSMNELSIVNVPVSVKLLLNHDVSLEGWPRLLKHPLALTEDWFTTGVDQVKHRATEYIR